MLVPTIHGPGLEGLPPRTLRRHKVVTHSVRFWGPLKEAEIRANFAEAWSARDARPEPRPLTAWVSTERVRYWLVRRGSVFFAVVVLALTLLKYGAGVFPSWPLMQALARNWRHPMVSPRLAPPADYLVGLPTSAVVVGWLHLTSGRAYLGFHLVLACAAIVVPFALRPVRRSPELRLGVSLLLVGGAVPALLLDWVGLRPG